MNYYESAAYGKVCEVAFWRKFKDTLIQYEQDFILEGSKELFDSNVKEAEFILQGVAAGRTYRNLYLIQRKNAL